MSAKLGRSLCVGGVLDNDHGELLVGRNHNLVNLGANFDEGDFFARVQVLDRHSRLLHELRDQTAIVDCFVLLHRRLHRHAVLVHDNYAQHTHMCVDAIQRFFHLLR